MPAGKSIRDGAGSSNDGFPDCPTTYLGDRLLQVPGLRSRSRPAALQIGVRPAALAPRPRSFPGSDPRPELLRYAQSFPLSAAATNPRQKPPQIPATSPLSP